MEPLYPFRFMPAYMARIWGGRNLERLYGKPLPPNAVIGESWEISDRPEAVSVIANGPLAGRDLRWLMQHRERGVLGTAKSLNGRFPLLVKILDAQDILSLQVHPPAPIAARLGGEAKTEVWYIASATPEAELYVGLKRGVSRTEFERRIASGSVADCFHRIPVRAGDAMFLPSGRVHAIGRGNVIFEIQQNSDTTYRVFDWNRVDSSGQPRALHIRESLESIDFNDFEPEKVPTAKPGQKENARKLTPGEPFEVEERVLPAGGRTTLRLEKAVVLGVITGQLRVSDPRVPLLLSEGEFALIPAEAMTAELSAETETRFLEAKPN